MRSRLYLCHEAENSRQYLSASDSANTTFHVPCHTCCRFGSELSSVEERVKNVLGRKDGMIQELDKDIGKKSELGEKLSKELDAMRKADLVGGR